MLGMEILVIIGLILLLLVLWIISVQRKFAVMDGNIQNAMNQIGVQISSRFDALFAVLDLMKGYAGVRNPHGSQTARQICLFPEEDGKIRSVLC